MIETGALEQAYAKVESTYAADAATGGETLSGTDAIRHLELSLTSKKNREASPEKRGTPDQAQSLPRRQTSAFNLSSVMWEPSGTAGTISNVGKFLDAGFGSKNQITGGLETTVLASPSPTATGCSLSDAGGLEPGDIIAITVNGVREATRILTTSLWSLFLAAPTLALAGDGAGNVDDGLHSYRVTAIHPDFGETVLGAAATIEVVDNTTDGKVAVSVIALGPSGTTSRRVWRTEAGQHLTGPWKLLTTLADNTTTVFQDNVADSGLGVDAAFQAITYDELSDVPDDPGAVVAGITYKLANNLTKTLALYKFFNAGGFYQATFGNVVDQIQASFDGTREVLLAIQGPGGRYADASPGGGTVQAKPATHVTVGSPVGGMIGSFRVDEHDFLVIACQVTVNNQIELRNKELGTAWASGIAGRTNMRQVGVQITFYLEDTRLLGLANTVTRGVLRCLVGDGAGGMLAAVLPGVEFEIPDVGNEIGPKELTIEGVAYATVGNDQVFMAEL
jgi:hypothetical protein